MKGQKKVKINIFNDQVAGHLSGKIYKYLFQHSDDCYFTITDQILIDISQSIKSTPKSVETVICSLIKTGSLSLEEQTYPRRHKHYAHLECGTREYNRAITLQNKYGISLKELEELYEQQDSSCAICKKSEEELGSRLHLDHCHSTGRIRGLLCGNCNKAIGLLSDDIDRINSAANYLSSF